MARRRSRASLVDLPRRIIGDVMAHGWALPLIAFALSCVISYVAGKAVLEGGSEWWRLPGAALIFLAQWAANVSLLRARMTEGGDRRNFLCAWAMCAFIAACGLFHAYWEVRAEAWAVETEHRVAERGPLVERLAAVNAEILAAQGELRAISAQARELQWPSERAERYSAPQREVLNGPAGRPELGALARAQAAQAALNRLPALEARPLDWLDGLAAGVALVLAGLEFAFYWSMLAQAARKVEEERRPPAPEVVEELVAGDVSGVLIGLAKHRITRAAALGAGLALGSVQAAAAHERPAASQWPTTSGAPPADGQPLADAGQPSPEEVADALLVQGISRRGVMRQTGLSRYQVDNRAAAMGLVKAR